MIRMRKRKLIIGVVAVVVCICAVAAAACLIVGRENPGDDGSRNPQAEETPTPAVQAVEDAGLRRCLVGAFPDAFSEDADSDGTDAITDLVFPMLASEHAEDCGDLSKVRSLDGMQELSNLHNLDLGPMTALDSGAPLADLTGLQQLNISQTAITDIGFVSGMSELSQVALPPTACDVSSLAGHDAIRSVSVGCASADIAALDGMGVQIVVPAGFDAAKARSSAATGNTVTVMNDDGNFDVYQLVDGEVTVSHV